MILEEAPKKLDVVDSVLTKIGVIFKKHWWVLLILLIGWFFYWALSTPLPPIEPQELPVYYEDTTQYEE